MIRRQMSLGRIAAWGTLLVMLAVFFAPRAHAACTGAACVMAGPRLLSLNTNESALLSPLTQALLGTSVTATAADWNALAGADLSVLSFANALKAQTGAITPNDALTGTATLAQVFTAAANAASNDGNTALASAITNLTGKIAVPAQSINLANIFSTTGNLGDSKLSVLDILNGAIEAHNYQYGVNTPAAVSVGTPGLLGIAGVTAVTIQARVVEPPVYFCGGVGSSVSPQFHTAAIRLKINLTIPQPLQQTGLFNGGLITASDLTVLPNFSVYVNVARADGYISQLTPTSGSTGAFRVQIKPGVTGIYMGTIADSFFFTRTNGITAASFGWADIADTHIKLVGISLITGTVQLKAAATGSATSYEEMIFNGPFPQTQTTAAGLNGVGNLITTLLGSGLQLNANINLLGLVSLSVVSDGALAPILAAISAPITAVLGGVADPLLNTLGIKIGQAVVTAYGVFNFCNVTGNCYSDANHSSVKDPAEAGTGQTLYAKLIANTAPTAVYASTAVDSATGAFSFASVQANGSSGTNYTLIIDTNSTANDVTATRPTGWISTETPTFSRAFTLLASDITGQTYGLYNGSSLTGRVFVDTGVGSGTANNAVRDGTEPGLPGARVSVTDNAGTTLYDSTLAGDAGVYTLWVPAAAGASALKITETNPASYLSTGASAGTTSGSYARATDTVSFTHVIGSQYTGVNFADVPSASFLTDGRQVVLPGSVAFYGHVFTAGTAGSVTFATSAPSLAGWSNQIYVDTNCNGAIDSGEARVTGAIAVTAAQKVCLVVRVFASQVAAYNDEYPVTLSATFAWSGSGFGETFGRNDLTVAGSEQGAGLALIKTVDKATAASGNTLLYTITYTNHSKGPLSQVKIYDNTPAYTVYTSGACGTLGAGLSACALTTQPGVGTTGALMWTLTGSLTSGATGTVTFTVTVQ